MASIFERLSEIIVEQLGVDKTQVVPSASFVDDFNIDPSDLAELIGAIEEEFSTAEEKIEIPDNDAKEIITVQGAIDFLRDCGIED